MFDSAYRGRRAATLENDALRVTVLREGGHIAEIFDKETGVNPLWTPPWPSIEPSTYDPARDSEYGDGIDARLLAGIMGHNLCVDVFGAPSEEEFAAGVGVHGESSVTAYAYDGKSFHAGLPLAGLSFERRIELHGRAIHIEESLTNLSATDRPVAWTQHVTLGPPFLEKGATRFRASATRSKVYESKFGADDYLTPAAEFDWPNGLDVFTSAPKSCAFTSHLMDAEVENAYFLAFSPRFRLAFGYVWRQSDFPWLGIWEENHSRTHAPWNGRTLTRGMEFGASPIPETRRAMIDRGRLFGVPTYRWLPARATATVEYWVVLQTADIVPEMIARP